MKLKLSECAQIAEIIGAFVIVLSLVFVGVQLNENAKATRSATANATIASMSSWYAGNGQNEQASANLLNAMGKPDEQTHEEWFQFVINFHAFMLNAQNSYYLVGEGTLDLKIRDSLTAVFAGVKDQPGFHRYWAQRRSIFSPEFQNYVDTILASEQVTSEGLWYEIDPTEQSN